MIKALAPLQTTPELRAWILAYWQGLSTETFQRQLLADAERAEELLEALRKAYERLEAIYTRNTAGDRIEHEPGDIPDGIYCRDTTIKLQRERLLEQGKIIDALDRLGGGCDSYPECRCARCTVALLVNSYKLKRGS